MESQGQPSLFSSFLYSGRRVGQEAWNRNKEVGNGCGVQCLLQEKRKRGRQCEPAWLLQHLLSHQPVVDSCEVSL